MYINSVSNQNFKGFIPRRVLLNMPAKAKQYKFMHESCYKLSEMLGQPTSRLFEATEGADIKQFTFLKTMANKFNRQNFYRVNDDSEKVLDIYKMVQKPTAMHVSIVAGSHDSFEFLEKIFSLAKDEKSLEFVQNMQHDTLREAKNPTKVISELLTMKNSEKVMNKPESYASYLKLHSDENDAVRKLDDLISSGKYSRLRWDAQYAIRKLMRKQKVEVAMAGKTSDLEALYTKDREGFLKNLIKNFVPARKTPKEETKTVMVNMYGSTTAENAKLRNAVIERFRNLPVKDRAAEIVEMQTLFNKIDNNPEAKTFVQKAIIKDLQVGSIAELNEVIDAAPLKKANVFFNNAKRIIERSTGEERKQALVEELENPFFVSKAPKAKKVRMVRMFDNRQHQEGFFTRTAKIIENKINQYKYSKMCA